MPLKMRSETGSEMSWMRINRSIRLRLNSTITNEERNGKKGAGSNERGGETGKTGRGRRDDR